MISCEYVLATYNQKSRAILSEKSVFLRLKILVCNNSKYRLYCIVRERMLSFGT